MFQSIDLKNLVHFGHWKVTNFNYKICDDFKILEKENLW
jgi:hypothetical protein